MTHIISILMALVLCVQVSAEAAVEEYGMSPCAELDAAAAVAAASEGQ